MTKIKYDYKSIFSKEQKLSRALCIQKLHEIDQSEDLFDKVDSTKKKLIERFKKSAAKEPEIDGKSLNPIVLGMVAFKNNFQSPVDLDEILKISKEFSSFETSSGRIVEDIFPIEYGFETVKTEAHDPFSEIDCKRIENGVAHLVALKSGPSCINDSMSKRIGNSIAENNCEWFEKYSVNEIVFTVAMNYGTAKLSNKKDWHTIRLAEESLTSAGYEIEVSCIKEGKIAHPYFIAKQNDKTLRVQTLQGKALWDYITRNEIGFYVLVLALVMASIENPDVSEDKNVMTKNLVETIRIDSELDLLTEFNNIDEEYVPWFFLMVRHFVDDLTN